MILERTTWWLLGTSLLVGCAAGYPDARSSSVAAGRDGGTAARDGATAGDPVPSAPATADATRAEPARADEPEPQSWGESLDEFVFGSAPSKRGTRRDDAPRSDARSDGAASAARALELQKEGSLALDAGRAEEAFAKFQAAYDVAPADARWKYLLVMANLRTGMHRDREALDLYLRLVEIRPRRPRIDDLLYGNLALVYYRLDRLAEAKEAVARALEANPEFPEGLRTLGLIEIGEGRVESGIQLLEKAIALKPDIPEAQVALAEYEESIGRREEAAARYRYLLEVMASDGFQDPLGRWRNLFGVGKPDTEGEFRARIERLESSGENTENARG